MKRKIIVISAIGLLFFVPQSNVYGIQIEITDNSNGDNDVVVQNEQSTQVEQSNNAKIENNIETNANTGKNNANNNTSKETVIDTGNINETVKVVNNANISQVTIECCKNKDCCGQNQEILISGNTNSGNNSVKSNTANTTIVTTKNNARIENNIKGTANTGYNQANGNTGTVSIITGSITVSERIENNAINKNRVSVGIGGGNIVIKIKNNSNLGRNSINHSDKIYQEFNLQNKADVVNNSAWDLNTGQNSANDNIGNVSIETGKILLSSTISNTVNDNWTALKCCEEEINPPSAVPIDPPKDTPLESPKTPTNSSKGDDNGSSGNGNGNSNTNGKSSGSGVGGVAGAILPATGASWWLYATIANITMLLMGLYLRLRAGRAPARV